MNANCSRFSKPDSTGALPLPDWLLLLSYGLLGCYALFAQVAGMREMLVVFYGNELCVGVILAAWLIGVAVGAGGMARVPERWRRNLSLYLSLLGLLCLVFPLQITGIRLLRQLLQVPAGTLIAPGQLLLGTLATITPFSVFVGALFPAACSLAPSADARHLARVYIVEAIGSMLGGAAFTFWLVSRYHAFQIAMAGGAGLLFIIGGIAFRYVPRRPTRYVLTAVALIGGLGYGAAVFSGGADWLHVRTRAARWRNMHPGMELREAADSRYAHLSLGLLAGQYTLFSNGQYAAAFPDAYDAAITAHFYLTEHPAPRRVLLIGGGAEGMLSEILKHPVAALDYVELDPQALELIRPYLPSAARQALADPRVTIRYADGRYYVKQTPRRYDLVILNLPDPTNAMLNRFYTLEFFEEVRRVLRPGGAVISDLSSSLHLQQDAANYSGSLYKTLRAVFPEVLVTPGATNTYLAATAPGVITLDPVVLAERYLAREIDSAYFSEYHYDTLLQADQIAFVERTLRRRIAHFRLNTDLQPITYFYSLLLWTRFAETQPEREADSLAGRLLRWLRTLPVWWTFAPILLVVLLRLGYVWQKPTRSTAAITRFNCVWTIGATGFAGMALELILLFAFQNIYGYLYQAVGLFVAVFMVGLAAGGYGSHWLAQRNPQPASQLIRYLLVCQVVLVLFAAGLPLLVQQLSGLAAPFLIETVFLGLVGAAGLATGFEFPLAGAIALDRQARPGPTAGMLDSADHLGACGGALLMGVLCIPIFGLTAACYLVAALNLSSVALWLLHPRVLQ